MCKYVPVHDNEHIPNLYCGYQMSVKNIVSATLVMSPCQTEDFAHMKGLEPTPQEWHEEHPHQGIIYVSIGGRINL